MSVYYENGQLRRVVYKEEPEQLAGSNLCKVGTRFVFTKQVSSSDMVAVMVA